MADATAKSPRSCYAIYIDGTFAPDPGDAVYDIVGTDSEDLSVELNPTVETKKNILDEVMVVHSGYEPSIDVSDYFHRAKNTLSAKIAELAASRASGEACKTHIVEVLYEADENLKAAPTTIWAYRQPIYCIPTSYGGSTDGFQTPFQVNFTGTRVKGSWVRETKKFTAAGAEL